MKDPQRASRFAFECRGWTAEELRLVFTGFVLFLVRREKGAARGLRQLAVPLTMSALITKLPPHARRGHPIPSGST